MLLPWKWIFRVVLVFVFGLLSSSSSPSNSSGSSHGVQAFVTRYVPTHYNYNNCGRRQQQHPTGSHRLLVTVVSTRRPPPTTSSSLSSSSSPYTSFSIPSALRRRPNLSRTTCLYNNNNKLSSSSLKEEESEFPFDGRTSAGIVVGQSALIGIAVVAAAIVGTPNYGLGPGIQWTAHAIQQGLLFVGPLAILVAILDALESRSPALQDVTKATQRSVLALLGGSLKPITALGTAIALGLVAGVGEEMLFRGVLQYEIATRFGELGAVVVASIVFGALHAVTPLYALLATIASGYFGWLYLASGNLLVPIVTHAIYDVGALLYAHWTIAKMSKEEQLELANWEGPLGAMTKQTNSDI